LIIVERSEKCVFFYLDSNEEDSDDISFKSTPIIQDDEESLHRTPSSLNNYSILPPIKSVNEDHNSSPQYFIKQLQEKYQQQNGLSLVRLEFIFISMMFLFFKGTTEIGNDAKLDDAYLKMKRLDKALEEAFEKEKQVKIETMSLMKKYISIRDRNSY
jgi:hypothetical protein